MKSSEFKNTLKEYHNMFVDSITELDDKLQKQLKKIKQEHNDIILNEKIKLLVEICQGEKLDFEIIKMKYLKNKELSQITAEVLPQDKNIVEEELLDLIQYNGKEYYYKTTGEKTVYDMESKPIGFYKDNMIIFS